ncbi:TatD family hydrolase [Nicoliella spurrieriana]|uniref:TatD family hydrolase n=1 Tax=Nicoliella spurrieriana TaxID=2925830 RepID=A0A976RSI1_9LACO|nr:TatD family hydrolase [Nicoliella spurrieriana]UQS87072.1 TatD family hydrolase [Nicoliella spurrieriana]
MKIFDSHTHLNDAILYPDAQQYIEHARKLGVVKMAIVGSDAKLNRLAIQLAHQYDNLYAIVGYHPEEANSFDAAAENELIDQLNDPKVVAVGEIGLDYHQNVVKQSVQKRVFKRQIEIAKDAGLPISVHNRDAFEDTYDILKSADVSKTHGILHSFNGDAQWARKFVDLGMLISFSGVASFKKTYEVHAAAEQTPLDKILVETDAPYLAPEPYRGKQNEPGYTLYTVEAIARYRDTTPDVIADATYQNTLRLFGIEAS